MNNQTVWPQEVKALFHLISDAPRLDSALQCRLHYHINRLLLMGISQEIIRAELAQLITALESRYDA